MGNTVKQAKKVKKLRVASFDVYKVKQVRTFKPVNKRAKAYAKALGVKTLSVKQLREVKAQGKHRVVVYDNPLSTHFTAARV